MGFAEKSKMHPMFATGKAFLVAKGAKNSQKTGDFVQK